MSNNKLVARMIEERGDSTADDLWPGLPDLTRRQVIKALDNFMRAGLLRVVRPGVAGFRNHSVATLYGRTDKPIDQVQPEPPPPAAKADEDEGDERPLSHAGLPPRGRIPNVASVWELGRL